MSQLQLDEFYLTKLSIDFVIPQSNVEISSDFDLGFDYQTLAHSEDPLRRKMILSVKGMQKDTSGNPLAFQVRCDIVGIFVLPEDLATETRESLFLLNGVSILYSTLRGVIGSATGSFPTGTLCLPTVLPQDVIKMVQDRKNASRVKPKGIKRRSKKSAASK